MIVNNKVIILIKLGQFVSAIRSLLLCTVLLRISDWGFWHWTLTDPNIYFSGTLLPLLKPGPCSEFQYECPRKHFSIHESGSKLHTPAFCLCTPNSGPPLPTPTKGFFVIGLACRTSPWLKRGCYRQLPVAFSCPSPRGYVTHRTGSGLFRLTDQQLSPFGRTTRWVKTFAL